MSDNPAHPLFSVFGVEIEIMCVAQDSLRVWPHVDKLLTVLGGSPDSHPAFGLTEADNELAAHVVEFKLSRPAPGFASLWRDFLGLAQKANQALAKEGAMLFPGGVHPFMNPQTDSRLWPYEDSPIYSAYDRIFGCQGHGWFNLQSVHLNLPFRGDAEFASLHSAIALLLPLLPGLSNSSPVLDGEINGWHSSRLRQYAGNQRKIASIAGHLIPEAVASEQEYRDTVLAPMYRDIAPVDPEGLLQDEWLNSRAAIARFDRHAIEIRCLDAQETPRADVGLTWAIASMLRFVMQNGGDVLAAHRASALPELRAFFEASAREGLATAVPAAYPWRVLGLGESDFKSGQPRNAGELLAALFHKTLKAGSLAGEEDYRPVLDRIFSQGSLAERLLAKAKSLPGHAPKGEAWAGIYRELSDCLVNDRLV